MANIPVAKYTNGEEIIPKDDLVGRIKWQLANDWSDLYEVAEIATHGKKNASEKLNEAGFVGIHYFGQRDGECYVIFDDNDAVITDHVRFHTANNSENAEQDVEDDTQKRVEKRVSDLRKAANLIHNWLDTKTRGKSFKIELPERVSRLIKKRIGKDFDSHNITANGIVHAYNNHGENGKKLTNYSIPLTKDNISLVPYIMVAPDYIAKGTTNDNRESIRFYKNLSNGYVVVAEKEYKNSPNDMETITMWAELSERATNAQRNVAPDTHVLNAIPDIDVAKIIKEAETAIEIDKKNKEIFQYADNQSQKTDKKYADAYKNGDDIRFHTISENDVFSDEISKYTNEEQEKLKWLKNIEEKGIVTAVKAKGKDYYKCNRIGCKNNVSATELHDKYQSLLLGYEIPEECFKPFETVIKQLIQEGNKESEIQSTFLKKSLTEVDKKIEKCKVRYACGEIDTDTRNTAMETLTNQKMKIEQELNQYTTTLSNLDERVSDIIIKCSKLSTLWKNGDLNTKQKLQNLVFPDGILWEKQKRNYRTEKCNAFFDLLNRYSISYGQKNRTPSAKDVPLCAE